MKQKTEKTRDTNSLSFERVKRIDKLLTRMKKIQIANTGDEKADPKVREILQTVVHI